MSLDPRPPTANGTATLSYDFDMEPALDPSIDEVTIEMETFDGEKTSYIVLRDSGGSVEVDIPVTESLAFRDQSENSNDLATSVNPDV